MVKQFPLVSSFLDLMQQTDGFKAWQQLQRPILVTATDIPSLVEFELRRKLREAHRHTEDQQTKEKELRGSMQQEIDEIKQQMEQQVAKTEAANSRMTTLRTRLGRVEKENNELKDFQERAIGLQAQNDVLQTQLKASTEAQQQHAEVAITEAEEKTNLSKQLEAQKVLYEKESAKLKEQREQFSKQSEEKTCLKKENGKLQIQLSKLNLLLQQDSATGPDEVKLQREIVQLNNQVKVLQMQLEQATQKGRLQEQSSSRHTTGDGEHAVQRDGAPAKQSVHAGDALKQQQGARRAYSQEELEMFDKDHDGTIDDHEMTRVERHRRQQQRELQIKELEEQQGKRRGAQTQQQLQDSAPHSETVPSDKSEGRNPFMNQILGNVQQRAQETVRREIETAVGRKAPEVVEITDWDKTPGSRGGIRHPMLNQVVGNIQQRASDRSKAPASRVGKRHPMLNELLGNVQQRARDASCVRGLQPTEEFEQLKMQLLQVERENAALKKRLEQQTSKRL